MRLVPAVAQAVDPGRHRGGTAGRAVTEVDPQHADHGTAPAWHAGTPVVRGGVVPSTHGRCEPSPPDSGAWQSPGIGIRVSGRDRTIRWLTAALIATSILAIAVVPAFAVDPSPEPFASPRLALGQPFGQPPPAPTASPAPWPKPSWPTTVTTLGSSVKLYGLGYGHGVGMSQYGAKGRALAGQTAEQILAAYFKGATLSDDQPHPADPRPRAQRVRRPVDGAARPRRPRRHVGLHGDRDGLPGRRPAPGLAEDDDDRRNDDHDLARQGAGAGRDDGPPLGRRDGGARPCGPSRRRPPSRSPPNVEPTTRTAAASCSCSARARLSVVNHVELDQYLRGVVPAEMPTSWPREALRAQVDRRPQLRGARAQPGDRDLRHGRRHAVADLPRHQGRAVRHRCADRR